MREKERGRERFLRRSRANEHRIRASCRAFALWGVLLSAGAAMAASPAARLAPAAPAPLAEPASAGSAEVDALVAEALEKNPDLAAAKHEAAATRARVASAGALPDPML